jgi:predicted ArsR family transcriptional regulator
MSTSELENVRAPRPAADRLLGLLKTGGPQSTGALAAALGVTTEAARQQLLKMAADGLVTARSESHGVGRPAQVWSLTAAGNARFPDRHSELTVQLIRTVRTELGQAALDGLIDSRSQEARSCYIAAMAGSVDLADRVVRLADIRSREGYMAEWKRDGTDFLLIENHCPICAAATECQGFCRSELEVFSEALGPEVSIDRTEHIVAGARRCVYRIQARPKSSTDRIHNAGDAELATTSSPRKRSRDAQK